MAIKRVIKIDLPELNRTKGDNRLTTGECVLVLETDKAYRGGVDASGRVHWREFGSGFITTVLFQDYAKTYVARPGIATQKAIDRLHAEIFTPERIEQIKAEVVAFYQALSVKQAQEAARYATPAGWNEVTA